MTVLLINQYCAAIPYEEFIGFPFGEEQGDQFFPRILDHSIPIRIPHDTLPFSFPFFGENYPFVIVSYLILLCKSNLQKIAPPMVNYLESPLSLSKIGHIL